MHSINNEIYNELGDRWYEAFDDPVALLRAEAKLIAPWIIMTAQKKLGRSSLTAADLGCGGGFISNELALKGFKTIAFDLSETSLMVAKKYDQTRSVDYRIGDVTNLPMPDASCDVVTCCDVIEHVENPERIVSEAYRILKPQGMFFFHTFNRTFIAYMVVIKFVEWFVKNTPEHLHILSLFVKPKELEQWCTDAGFKEFVTRGIRPKFRTLFHKDALFGVVPKTLQFTFTNNQSISYAGFAVKP